eukprot:3918330-Prymnesium_polylepis.1
MPTTLLSTSTAPSGRRMPNSHPVGSRFRLAALSPVDVKSSYDATYCGAGSASCKMDSLMKFVSTHFVVVEPSIKDVAPSNGFA